MTIEPFSIPVEITIKMTTVDFDFLYDSSMNWADTDWRAHDGRFSPLPDYRMWQRAYWFESRVNFMLAKSLMDALGVDYAETVDSYTEDSVLLTNYGGAL